MKVRNGFVSNSSSSSFIIAFHNGNKKQLSKKLDDIFGNIPKNYPIKNMPSFSEAFGNNIGEEFKTTDDWVDYFDIDVDDMSENEEFIHSKLQQGWLVLEGGFSDSENDITSFLCNVDIDYEDKEIYIHQDGGY
jgi:hypothetical protein